MQKCVIAETATDSCEASQSEHLTPRDYSTTFIQWSPVAHHVRLLFKVVFLCKSDDNGLLISATSVTSGSVYSLFLEKHAILRAIIPYYPEVYKQ